MVPTAEAAMIFQMTVRLKPDTAYEEAGIAAGIWEVGIAAAA
jgi:hypothetical protein